MPRSCTFPVRGSGQLAVHKKDTQKPSFIEVRACLVSLMAMNILHRAVASKRGNKDAYFTGLYFVFGLDMTPSRNFQSIYVRKKMAFIADGVDKGF